MRALNHPVTIPPPSAPNNTNSVQPFGARLLLGLVLPNLSADVGDHSALVALEHLANMLVEEHQSSIDTFSEDCADLTQAQQPTQVRSGENNAPPHAEYARLREKLFIEQLAAHTALRKYADYSEVPGAAGMQILPFPYLANLLAATPMTGNTEDLELFAEIFEVEKVLL